MERSRPAHEIGFPVPDSKIIVLIIWASTNYGDILAAELVKHERYHVLYAMDQTFYKRDMYEHKFRCLGAPSVAGSAELLSINTGSNDCVEDTVKAVGEKYGRLDVLVHNIDEPDNDLDFHDEVNNSYFQVNVNNPLALECSFAHLLLRSNRVPRIVNLTVQYGSINAHHRMPHPYNQLHVHAYQLSAAALHMATYMQHETNVYGRIKLFAYCKRVQLRSRPGRLDYVLDEEVFREDVRALIDVLEGKRDHEAGCLLSQDGVHPW